MDKMQEQISNVSRKMEILSKNQKEMLDSKYIVTEINKEFDRFSIRLYMAEGRFSA